MQTGPNNLITDIAGLRVGHAQDDTLKSGASVLIGAAPFTCGVSVMGGAPGTRETDLLAPDKTVQQVDALTLSGGSAFGLDASSGVADALRHQGRGFPVGDQTVPIVPGAILFDLLNGGDKSWGDNPYKALGAAALAAADTEFALGSLGAGTGCTLASHIGGLGSASIILPSGHTVGALVAVNALGDASPDGQHFWAAPWEIDAEFGGRGLLPNAPTTLPNTKLSSHNTTIAIVATDAALTQAQCTRMATAAHDGMARALVPSHTPMDGDLIFGVSTDAKPLSDEIADTLWIGHAAATCLARAIARGVWHATPKPGDLLPCMNP
ncbi:P1 family peptidase [Shimia marina]|uniref:L-aminopeptidase/D-esterase n=1 Tax=Shimia marina TaxID=321267 RepID=A0A0P1FCS3_9RHOB|nr:P1 family peptidase [Shimia marina]CUH51208.1 L-aminopeptidase/D-esterase [Shimia marina]SFD55078.1 D-aminopeptidase [Shimia marina]